MLCEKASYLINQLKTSNDLAANYDEETIREIISEINDGFDNVRQTVQKHKDRLGTPAVATNLMVQRNAMLRNKQCVFAYLIHRLQRIQRLRWELNEKIPAEITSKFSQKEGEFLIKYDDMLEKYMQRIDLDLTVDQQPPKQLIIEVRVLKDCTLNSGKQLKAGTSCFLQRSDVEQLIRTGFLEHVV